VISSRDGEEKIKNPCPSSFGELSALRVRKRDVFIG
jgi:hypothetical protein